MHFSIPERTFAYKNIPRDLELAGAFQDQQISRLKHPQSE